MKHHRRYLTFSLRTLFILLTALAAWLGIVVNRAREQREAVKAIEALGGTVDYDWGSDHDPFGPDTGQPPGPAWLRRLLGDDYFQNVSEVSFYDYSARSPSPESGVLKSLPRLTRIRTLKQVEIPADFSEGTIDELKAALPNCRILYIPGRP